MVKQIEKAGLQLTQSGFGPWARVFREPEGSQRRCVQLCILPWNALDAREWDRKDDPQLTTMHPADLARYLGLYAARVTTPRGSTATTGLELMTALRPPTRAEKDPATGEFKRAFNGDALSQLYPVVECEPPTNTRSSRAVPPSPLAHPGRDTDGGALRLVPAADR